MITVEHRDDLRKVYMFTFDNFAVHPTEVANAHKGMNTRYARELLGALQHGNMIVLTEDGEGSEAWQVNIPGTYDDHKRFEAEAAIDKWLGVKAPNPTSATTPRASSNLKSGASGPHPCGCGCGETITTKSVYRPGHDARHAGAVGREIAANYTTKGFDRRELLATLGSDKLREKAERVAENATSKPTKAQVPTCVEGIVKVGKNERPARRWYKGTVEYLVPGQAEWKTASKSAAKTFQEG